MNEISIDQLRHLKNIKTINSEDTKVSDLHFEKLENNNIQDNVDEENKIYYFNNYLAKLDEYYKRREINKFLETYDKINKLMLFPEFKKQQKYRDIFAEIGIKYFKNGLIKIENYPLIKINEKISYKEFEKEIYKKIIKKLYNNSLNLDKNKFFRNMYYLFLISYFNPELLVEFNDTDKLLFSSEQIINDIIIYDCLKKIELFKNKSSNNYNLFESFFFDLSEEDKTVLKNVYTIEMKDVKL
ncbi:hypothetical protein [Fluviispira multicolorata]|uniref:Uncharacterized protein n=1 Tax=Fluviispira multicolorata TaxID=2654512 RepID=A0A833JG28_9BACT|nr:hypothetical protein [Fluviispira multicolorata]KAB8033650.1 hypothetical protein GCL57_02780 [Fluviispira multicolorata]